MKSKVAVAAAFLVLATAFVGSPAHAADIVYTTGPASQTTGWYIPVLALPQGTSVTFLNADIGSHDFVAKEYGPDDPRWCYFDPILNRRTYEIGKCPIFWSQLDGLASMHPVLGLENAVPGVMYTFVCTVHVAMKGTLVILPV